MRTDIGHVPLFYIRVKDKKEERRQLLKYINWMFHETEQKRYSLHDSMFHSHYTYKPFTHCGTLDLHIKFRTTETIVKVYKLDASAAASRMTCVILDSCYLIYNLVY